jgi:DNA-binding transcriptional LysR family regulator
MLETWDEATSELGEAAELRGTIRLHGPVVLGELYLGPIAVEFQRRHPAIRCELTFLDGFVDLVAERADLAVRLGTISDPAIVRRRLGSMERLLVASPGYLKARGVPKRPQDLRAHDWVRFSGLAGGDSQQVGRETVAFTPTFIANNAVVLKDALLRGLGVGLVTEWLVRRELKAGRLVEVLPGHPVTALETSVIFPSPRFVPARVRAFVDALEVGLRDALAATGPLSA